MTFAIANNYCKTRLCLSSARMWQGPLCAHKRLAWGSFLDLWKSRRKMSLEHEEETLGINNGRFNQGGFEVGGACAFTPSPPPLPIKKRRDWKHELWKALVHLEVPLRSRRKKDTLRAASVNSAGLPDSAKTQTNWQSELNKSKCKCSCHRSDMQDHSTRSLNQA